MEARHWKLALSHWLRLGLRLAYIAETYRGCKVIISIPVSQLLIALAYQIPVSGSSVMNSAYFRLQPILTSIETLLPLRHLPGAVPESSFKEACILPFPSHRRTASRSFRYPLSGGRGAPKPGFLSSIPPSQASGAARCRCCGTKVMARLPMPIIISQAGAPAGRAACPGARSADRYFLRDIERTFHE